MRTTLLVLIVAVLTFVRAYDLYWEHGEKLLNRLQSGKDEIFVITFFNPSPKKDDYTREFENKRVMDNLVIEVLNEQNDKPLRVNYANIDVTDRENEKLLYKANVHADMVDTGPVVLATRKGSGYTNWGPTVLHRVAEVIEMLQVQAKEDQETKK